MPNFCPRCNVATDPDAAFCAACGTRLNGRFKNGGNAERRALEKPFRRSAFGSAAKTLEKITVEAVL